jgi:hypothetical protein
MKNEQTYSRTSPKSGRRATLGSNGKYSRKNNKGFMINQGIGNLDGQGNSNITNTINERTETGQSVSNDLFEGHSE